MKVIYIIQGYESIDPVSRNMLSLATIEVYATTEKEAIRKAKKYVKKNEYRVDKVLEIDPELRSK